MLNYNKTTGWLASDYMRAMKMWLWTCQNAGAIIEEHFNNNNDDAKKQNGQKSLMCPRMQSPEGFQLLNTASSSSHRKTM